jgi:hypothetical protein
VRHRDKDYHRIAKAAPAHVRLSIWRGRDPTYRESGMHSPHPPSRVGMMSIFTRVVVGDAVMETTGTSFVGDLTLPCDYGL